MLAVIVKEQKGKVQCVASIEEHLHLVDNLGNTVNRFR